MNTKLVKLQGMILSIFLFNLYGYGQSIPEDQQLLPNGISLSEYFIRKPLPQKNLKKGLYPASWWTGMQWSSVEVMVHDTMIASSLFTINSSSLKIIKTEHVENPNYAFVTINILKNCKAGNYFLTAKSATQTRQYSFEILGRKKAKSKEEYVNAKDLMYLIMPDRFANGDKSNDNIPIMSQQGVDRSKMYFRHGGDLKGISNHLDYLDSLGVTALWLNPVFENDQPYASYHGYAITDHYEIDKRFGPLQDYIELSKNLHKRKMKLIMDIVHNHVGDGHFFIKDLPSSDWLNNWPSFTRSNYRDQTLYDPYSASLDKKIMLEGWFDLHMPDLNLKNKHLEKFFIQNHIWWIEYAQLDGYRLDTYPYCDQKFMSNWAKAISNEYPGFCMFGETMVQSTAAQSWFAEGKRMNKNFDSNMPGLTDFQSYYALLEAFDKPQGWAEGAAKLYTTIAQDYLYKNPLSQVIFLDNHDIGRFYSVVGENIEKFKSGLIWLLTCRGIPQLYYGTELAFKGLTNPDGKVRQDMPGGWEADNINKFNASGRTNQENEVFNLIKHLANYRKNNDFVSTGKMTQYIPQDGVYAYTRFDQHKKILVVINFNAREKSIPIEILNEEIKDKKSIHNVLTGQPFIYSEKVQLGPFNSLILEIQ